MWPKIEQMPAIAIDKPLSIHKLRWQVHKDYPHLIASIGITLANGSKSPMFTGVEKEHLSEI